MTVFVVRNRAEAKRKCCFHLSFLVIWTGGGRESEHSDNSLWLKTEEKKRKEERKNVFDFIQWFKIYVDR